MHRLIECYLQSLCAPSVHIDQANLGYNPEYKFRTLNICRFFFISVGKYCSIIRTIYLKYMYLNVPFNFLHVSVLHIIYRPVWLLKFTSCFDLTFSKQINLSINQKSPLHLIVLNKISLNMQFLLKKWTLDRVFYCMIPFPQFLPLCVFSLWWIFSRVYKRASFEVAPFSFPGRLRWQNVSPCLRSSVCLLVPRPCRVYSI